MIIAILVTIMLPSFLATASLAKEGAFLGQAQHAHLQEIQNNQDKKDEEEIVLDKEEELGDTKEEGEEQEEKIDLEQEKQDEIESEEKQEEEKIEPEIESVVEETNTMKTKAIPDASIQLPEGDGVYIISTALDENKVLDIGGGSTANAANVQLWENANVKQQKFEIRYNKQLKTYTIKATHSNKVLDVAGGGTANGTNVQQYESNGTVAQQWLLEDAGNGYFYVVSKCNGLYLEINKDKTDNGTNIEVNEGKQINSQKFKFAKTQDLIPLELPEGDGIYTISTALNQKKRLEIADGTYENSGNVQLGESTELRQQKFELTYNPISKTYTIKAKHSNKVLDVAGGGVRNGTNVQQFTSNGSLAQQWVLQDAGNGYFYVMSKCNGLYLDVNNGKAEDGTNIQVYQGNRTTAQKFKFTKVPEVKSEELADGDGIYRMVTALENDKVLEIANASYDNFANVQIGKKENKQQQRFEMKYNKELNTYTIMAVHSGKVLDVAGGNLRSGTNVQQFESNGSLAQQWVLQDAGNGYFYIMSKCNDLYLDVSTGSTKEGTNIQVYEGNRTVAQKFQLIKDEVNKSEKTIEEGIYQIHPKINENRIIQVESATRQLQIENQTEIINTNNRFKIEYLRNGYYTVKELRNGQNVTVENGGKVNGTKIKVQNQDNSTKQEWIIKQTADGYFNIIARCNGLAMDLTGNTDKLGTTLQMYEETGKETQKFSFEKIEEKIEGEKLLDNGVYYIQSALNLNKVLDVSQVSYDNYANIQLWQNVEAQQQKFQVTFNEQEKYYEIRVAHSGKALDANNCGKSNGTNVQQYENNGSMAQRWILQEAGNGYFYIFSKGSEMYLDVANGIARDAANIQLYEGNGTTAQKFKFARAKTIAEDIYKISIRNDTNKFWDISGGSKEEGANLQIWQNSNVNQQVFKVKYDADNKYCKIIAKHSNKVLAVTKDNNVVQETDTNSDNQKWSLEVVAYGYYKVKSKANGLYLDVDSNGTANGTNIKTYTGYNTNAQKFYFSGVRELDGVDVSEWQGPINWEFVRRAGVDFAIVRVGYGQHPHQKDKYFEQNYNGARAAGLRVGTYLYSYAQSVEDARREAYNCLNWLNGRYLDYPVFYDIEDPSQGWIDPQTMTDMIKAFCEIITNAGYKAGVYTFRDWFRHKIHTGQIGNYQIWLAHYTWDPNKRSDYEGYYNIWQYTSRGYVPGINGNADRNIEYRNY